MSLIINRNCDVVYSPDDCGWYGQEYPSGRTTAVYDSKAEAIAAVRRGDWDEVGR